MKLLIFEINGVLKLYNKKINSDFELNKIINYMNKNNIKSKTIKII